DLAGRLDPGRGTGAARGTGANAVPAAGGTAAKSAAAARGRAANSAAVKPPSGTNAFLYAFDAETGKELFSQELDSFNHFTGNPVVAGGRVYTVTWDGKLAAF